MKDGNLPEIDVAGIDVNTLTGAFFDCILEIVDSLGTPDLNREDSRVIIQQFRLSAVIVLQKKTKCGVNS